MRTIFCSMAMLAAITLGASAQSGTGISGTITDSTGAVVVGAEVIATRLDTGIVVHTTTDAAGNYAVAGLKPGQYKVLFTKPGFQTTSVAVAQVVSDQMLQESTALRINSVGSSVEVFSSLPGATGQPSQEDVFESNQQLRVLDRRQIETAGPVAGAAQMVALAPGANVTGYGNTGATKYTVGVNGVSQGWGGYGGYSGGGALAITFDGIPIVDPATSLWQSPTIPEQFIIQNINVTYGPGDPATRWYNNIGGMIEFTPVQPSAKAHADFSGTYGMFNQKDFSANLTSGIFHGWSAIVAAGVGSGNDFRVATDGFGNPSKDVAFFGKGIKSFQENSFEAGGYYAHGAGYRSQVIPTVANPLITIDGQSGSTQYSQQTSGFYSTLPYASYNKYDTNEMGLLYARQHVVIDPTISLDNTAWFLHIARSHYRINDVYNLGPQQEEWNSPYTDAVGDRLLVAKRLPFNTLTLGGYYISTLYNTRNNFFNPADGGSKRTANIGGKVRSGNFDQADFAITFQDDIHAGSRATFTPGIRYVGFRTGYANLAGQDFKLVSGAVLSTRICPTLASATPGNIKDQGSNCGGLQNRSGIEPSINATVRTLPWLQIYGGFSEALRAPQVGGGGGLFQSVDPSSYHLSRQSYYQAGLKIHHEGTGVLNSMLLTGAFYHQNWANQEIDTTLATGDTISANGTSAYKGFNASFDDDPIARLHLFANLNVETAIYSNYVTVLPLGSSQPQQSFNGLHVPYVPNSTINAGAFYSFRLGKDLRVEPMASFQYLGSQYIFDNNAVDSAGNPFPQPSTRTMPAYGTANLGVKVPFKFLEFNLNAQNVLNSKYLIYEYISSGGYFGTAGNGTPTQSSGYSLAYPGSPAGVYGGVAAHF